MLALLALTLAGCQVPQLNPGRVSAVAIGAHAGWFRRVNGRWPVDFAELIRLDCPRMDDGNFSAASTFEPLPARDTGRCNVLSELPYAVSMEARGRDLGVVVLRKKGPIVCSLVVLAPTMASARELSPLIRLKLFSFDCPGEGKAF